MQLTFDGDDARRCLGESLAAEGRRRPLPAQCQEPRFWRDDMLSTRRAALDFDFEVYGGYPSARPSDVDPAKLPAGLWVVFLEDEAVLTSNAPDPDHDIPTSEVIFLHESEVRDILESGASELVLDVWDTSHRVSAGYEECCP